MEVAERAENPLGKVYFVKIHLENPRQLFFQKCKCFTANAIIF